MLDANDLLEQLAAIEHERWSDWQRWVHFGAGTYKNPEGTITLCKADVDRWERQMNTPYAELSEQEKESDREQVRRYLPLVEAFYGAKDLSDEPDRPVRPLDDHAV